MSRAWPAPQFTKDQKVQGAAGDLWPTTLLYSRCAVTRWVNVTIDTDRLVQARANKDLW